VRRTDVTLDGAHAAFRETCDRRGLTTRIERGRLVIEVQGTEPVSHLLADALSQKLDVVEVAPRYDTLEDLFVRSGVGTEVAS